MKTLVLQVGATEAITTTGTAVAQPAITAVVAIVTAHARVQPAALAAFVATLARIQVIAIDDVARVENAVAVQAIPRAESAHEQIAILILGRVVGIFAILALRILNRGLGHYLIEFGELLEEWSREIELAAVRERIVAIAPPHRWFVDRVRFVRRIHRDHLLAGEIALAMMERSIISPCHATLVATIWT